MVANLTKPSVVMEIINKNNFKISKSLGQNFLVDEGIRQKIVASGDLSEADVVVEIGPGLGVLTQALLEKGCYVIAIELDKRIVPILAENFKEYEKFILINEDVLKVNVDSLVAERLGKRAYKVMANLPYYITTPIIMHLIESRFNIQNMVFMMQKEVAERIVAEPGSKAYGSLSVAVQYFTQPQLVLKVPNTVFIPKPEVESSVVKFVPRANPPVSLKNEKLFFKVVRAAFGQRRKTLQNALASGLAMEKLQVCNILTSIGIDENRRGETLSIQEFGQLANVLAEKLS